MPIAAELRNIVYLTGKRRCGTDIHRPHLLGHEPSWSQPYSGVSDVPRHRPVSDVPKQDIAPSATQHAEIANSRTPGRRPPSPVVPPAARALRPRGTSEKPSCRADSQAW